MQMIMPRLEGRLTCAVGLFNALINATTQSRRLLKFPRNASDAKQDSIEKQEQFIEGGDTELYYNWLLN